MVLFLGPSHWGDALLPCQECVEKMLPLCWRNVCPAWHRTVSFCRWQLLNCLLIPYANAFIYRYCILYDIIWLRIWVSWNFWWFTISRVFFPAWFEGAEFREGQNCCPRCVRKNGSVTTVPTWVWCFYWKNPKDEHCGQNPILLATFSLMLFYNFYTQSQSFWVDLTRWLTGHGLIILDRIGLVANVLSCSFKAFEFNLSLKYLWFFKWVSGVCIWSTLSF